MGRLLQLLLWGHEHHWQVIKETRLQWSDDFGGEGTGTRYYLQCTKCGNIKIRDCK